MMHPHPMMMHPMMNGGTPLGTPMMSGTPMLNGGTPMAPMPAPMGTPLGTPMMTPGATPMGGPMNRAAAAWTPHYTYS